MGLFDIFTQPQQQQQQPAAQEQPPAQQQQPQEPGSVPVPAAPATKSSATTAPNGVVPSGDNPAAQGSPLDGFKDLWEPNAEGGDKDKKPTTPQDLKPEDVQKIVSQANFANSLPPETLQAIAAGGEEAQKAFVSALNQVTQQALTQSILINHKIAGKQIGGALDGYSQTIPDMIRKSSVSDTNQQTNAVFNNPALKPVVDLVQTQLMQKHPNATPSEIAQKTQEYVSAMGEAFNPAPAEQPNAQGEDWGKFING